MASRLLFAFYGDDFTGSTDALEFLARAGIRTALFIAPPTPEQLDRYPGLQAFGIAGMTRSMAPQEMEQELRPAFDQLRQSGAPHVHYKICSTFDSSPAIGSIGKAIDIGTDIFGAAFVPLLVAAPALGRFCAFGNLFARMGIGSGGAVYRLDRHPSMSNHPVTPADESDLRLHLSKQTDKKTGLFDILQVELPEKEAKVALEKLVAEGAGIVLFDALYPSQMAGIGALIDAYASPGQPLFSAGSSGIEMALGSHWTREGLVEPVESWVDPGMAASMLVISGSCSPVTSGQIARAIGEGFAEVALDTAAIAAEEKLPALQQYVEETVMLMRQGRSVILHTSLGTSDPRIAATHAVFSRMGLPPTDTSRIYGTALGRIARAVAADISLERLVIAGGDTSSFAARALGIEAVEMIAPLTPGAPLCEAHAPGSPVDLLQVVFKGGQVGGEEYFRQVLEGRSS